MKESIRQIASEDCKGNDVKFGSLYGNIKGELGNEVQEGGENG